MKKILLGSLILVLSFAVSFPADAEQIRLGVADFVTRTGMIASNQLWQITELFTNVLSSSSENLEVIGSRGLQAFKNMSANDAASAGKSAGCQYVLLGSVMKNNMGHSQTYGGFLGTTPKTTTQTQTITIDTRIIDVKTGKVTFSASGTGIGAFSYDTKQYAKVGHSKKSLDEMMDRQNDMMKEAASSAASIVAEKVCAFLTGEYPKVSSIKPSSENAAKKSRKKSDKAKTPALGSVKIDRGASQGVKASALYRIYFEGEEVFDMSGGSLGREKFTIAIAEVKDVRSEFSTAEVTAGVLKNIRDGDKAEQISQEAAQLIIDRNDFARNRFSELLR
ncbi:MAG: hypothetical protein IJR68_03035 [Fretibacterium sp.]|nr:hypothetical protein [Fretibacterium sp.]